MDWSLVLLSQGIESTIEVSDETGWGLSVSKADYDRSVAIIQQYQTENLHWPWQQTIRSDILFDWGSLAWVFLILLFFWLSTETPVLRTRGIMDGEAVSDGEWWRLFTAVFLHGDVAHLAANATIGVILLGLAMGSYGTGVALLAAFLSGAAGNVFSWIIYQEHLSLGASGMVMATLGLLAATNTKDELRTVIPRPPFRQRWKPLITTIVGGILLFVLLGLSPKTNVVAHLGGFVGGLVFGIILAQKPSMTKSAPANILAGAAFSALTLLSWWLALRQ